MGTESALKTFQTVRYYEEALKRHGQWCRWLRALTCACVTPITNQPSISCTVCKGRGFIYKNPGPFSIEQEVAEHDSLGHVYPKNTPVIGGVSAWRVNTSLPINSVSSDGTVILLDPPYPRNYDLIRVHYQYDPVKVVVSEDSEVYGPNVLRVIQARFHDKGKEFEGSVDGVTRVFNFTKNETYTVVLAQKEYIYLEDMGTWQIGDVLQVDYTYLQPFDFVLHSISAKKRYERAYVIDSADATLITPYWANIQPNDLITSLSAIIPAYSIINPALTGIGANDSIADYYDLAWLTDVVDKNGVEYEVGVDLELYGRNEVKWLTQKPTVPYTVHFLYHPTFRALSTYDTSRHSENKSFVNRTNVMMFDKVSREVSY